MELPRERHRLVLDCGKTAGELYVFCEAVRKSRRLKMLYRIRHDYPLYIRESKSLSSDNFSSFVDIKRICFCLKVRRAHDELFKILCIENPFLIRVCIAVRYKTCYVSPFIRHAAIARYLFKLLARFLRYVETHVLVRVVSVVFRRDDFSHPEKHGIGHLEMLYIFRSLCQHLSVFSVYLHGVRVLVCPGCDIAIPIRSKAVFPKRAEGSIVFLII